MSVIQTVNPKISPHSFKEIESGVAVWKAKGEVTGDASGDPMTVRIQFNADASPSWQPYVTLTRVAWWIANNHGTYTALDAAAVEAADGSWEDWEGHQGSGPTLLTAVPVNELEIVSATANGGVFLGHLNLGRVMKSPSTGNLDVSIGNSNGDDFHVNAEGFLSQKPILARVWLGA